MEESIINETNKLLVIEKLSRKQIYENLISKGIVKPNSEKYVYTVLDYGLENNLINQNRILKSKKRRGKLPDIYSSEQLIKIFDSCDRPKLSIAMWLGFFCGLRISEVCNLKVSDVNINTRKIFVRDSKNPNRQNNFGYGKDGIITIPDIAISPINKWLDIVGSGVWFLPSMSHPDRPIRTKTIHEEFRHLLKICGLNEVEYKVNFRQKNFGKNKEMDKSVYKYRFHTLRHTYATYLLDKGVPLENIKKSLRHERIDTTLVYAKISDKKTDIFINEAFDKNLGLRKKRIEDIKPLNKEVKADIIENTNPIDILKLRLVKGEIDLITYKRILAEIEPNNSINIVVKKDNYI